MSSWIQTHTGIMVDPLEFTVDMLAIEDIAHALSHQCRYSGHCSEFYSVAEHSNRVAKLLYELSGERILALMGLMHDAPEAYLVDLPRPLKQSEVLGRAYRAYEGMIWNCVARKYGLSYTLPQQVHWADDVLLITEIRDLMPSVSGMPDEPKPLSEAIVPVTSKEAKAEFLALFEEYNK